jgi:hypothetical protein
MTPEERASVQHFRTDALVRAARNFGDLFERHPALWPLTGESVTSLELTQKLIAALLDENRRRNSNGSDMRGRNILILNQATLQEAVQAYLRSELFKHGEAPRVTGVEPRSTVPFEDPINWEYHITIDGPTAMPKDEEPAQ